MDNDEVVAHLIDLKTGQATMQADVTAMKRTLDGNGTPGLKATVVAHDRQLSYWRGAIAIIGFAVLVFGGTLIAHILGGGK